MFIIKTHVSKIYALTLASALFLSTMPSHTSHPAAPIAHSTHARASKKTDSKDSAITQSSSPSTVKAVAKTLLKAGYNLNKLVGIGTFGFLAYISLEQLAEELANNKFKIKPDPKKFTHAREAFFSLTSLSALSKSIYDSYAKTESNPTPATNSRLKQVAKALYNFGKIQGIVFAGQLIYEEIIIRNPTKERILIGMMCATIAAALGESVYNDYKATERIPADDGSNSALTSDSSNTVVANKSNATTTTARAISAKPTYTTR